MRVKGVVRVFLGLLLNIVGLALYLSPELNWVGLIGTSSLLLHKIIMEIIRFWEDPIALVGLIIMVVGLWMTLDGVKEAILGRTARN